MDKSQKLMNTLRNSQRLIILCLVYLLWCVLTCFHSLLRAVRALCNSKSNNDPNCNGIAAGKTVLVTTGRQAKTLHTVRALKAVGAHVIVSDYESISASAVSVDCDEFVKLPCFTTIPVHDWVNYFHDILVKYSVDVVIPVSTINEVLAFGLAKDMLERKLPNVQWICPNLEQAINFDDRSQFQRICSTYSIPSPDGGTITETSMITSTASKFQNGIMLKRIESSVNRAEEIVHILPEHDVPQFVKPSTTDVWQWQRFISGTEASVWYICLNGRVTFTGCYYSEADLTKFDSAPVPPEIDRPLRRLIAGMNLTGQYAFDFIIDEESNCPYVIECNPRSSSVLETVSQTPLWAESFFGVDVTLRTVHGSVGFLYHRNCWPWTSGKDGYLSWRDPLPAFAAEVVWPLNAIATKGMTDLGYQKIDVNICKIILYGPSPSRNMNFYQHELIDRKVDFLEKSLQHVNTILLDVTTPQASRIAKHAEKCGVNIVPFYCTDGDVPAHLDERFPNMGTIIPGTLSDLFFSRLIDGETRLVLGTELSNKTGSLSPLSYRVVTKKGTLRQNAELPLRRKRILHVIGSNTSEYYDGVSSYYGFGCINFIKSTNRFEHSIAYVHTNGEWSVEGEVDAEYIRNIAAKMEVGQALDKILSLNVDVVLPHLFDYDGLTAFRSLFDVLQIPVMGCSGDALALSTNKMRTNAVAAAAGVPVAPSEVLGIGDAPSKIRPPLVLKPTEEDNSLGVELVHSEADIPECLERAFKCSDELLCEKFIALGKELRVAVLENPNGELEMLPAVEYILPKDFPVRKPTDKLNTDERGKPTTPVKVERRIPADIDDAMYSELCDAVTKAHKVLGCRDYSIYDFRIDPEGSPFMLESCLYCSFASSSVLVLMAQAKGLSGHSLFERSVEWAMARRVIRTGTVQHSGMKLC